MTHGEAIALLSQSRAVLERYLFDEREECRDDVAEICMKIDDRLDFGRSMWSLAPQMVGVVHEA